MEKEYLLEAAEAISNKIDTMSSDMRMYLEEIHLIADDIEKLKDDAHSLLSYIERMGKATDDELSTQMWWLARRLAEACRNQDCSCFTYDSPCGNDKQCANATAYMWVMKAHEETSGKLPLA